MTKLECHVNSCTNNSANFCRPPNIKVSKTMAFSSEQACCSSYVSQQDGAFSNSMVGSIPNESMPVDYTATNCPYNASGSCATGSICVSGNGASEKGEISCLTFHQS